MKKLFYSYILIILAVTGVSFDAKAQASSTGSSPAPGNVPTAVSNAPLPPTVGVDPLPATFSSSTGFLNFLRTYVPQVPVTDVSSGIFNLAPVGTNYTAKVRTTYFNGWGNQLESITRGAPGTGTSACKDIITMTDRRPSRTTNSYLPFPAADFSDHFHASPFIDQQSYYSMAAPEEQGMTYSQSSSFISGTTPVTNSYLPGSSFVGNQKGTTSATTIEDGSSGVESYAIRGGVLTDLGAYPPGTLTKILTAGQNHAESLSFYDKSGALVCKEQYVGTASGSPTDWMVTNYVYDDLGHLAYILTPRANNSGDVTGTLQQLSFGYTYDQYGERIATSKPGKTAADAVVYDSKHRPVLSQTALLQSTSQYAFRIYDSRDRVVMSGIFTNSSTPDHLQALLNAAPATIPSNLLPYYLIHGFTGTYPTSIPDCEIDVINYYDQYPAFLTGTGTGFDNSFSADYLTGINMISPVVYNVTQGMLTGSQVRVKDGITTTTNVWETNKYFYDQKGNLIQQKTQNPWNTTAWDVATLQYNFSGQLVQKIVKQNDISPNPVIKVATVYNYDIYHNGRLLNVQQRINSDAWRDIADYQYDALGRVKQKQLGGGRGTGLYL